MAEVGGISSKFKLRVIMLDGGVCVMKLCRVLRGYFTVTVGEGEKRPSKTSLRKRN